MKIAEIFQELGEEKFRDLESAALRELCDCPNIIVATGGGVLQKENTMFLCLSKKGFYFLDADPEKLYQRASKRKFKRPKMKNLSMEGFIELYKERRNLYSSVANFTINVNELKPFEIAEKIKKIMNQIEIRGSNKTTNLNFVGSIDDVLSFISKSNQIIFVDKTLKTSTEALSDFLDERIEDVFLVDHAEENKNLSKAEEAYKFLTEKNINRDHEIVAIGGGALTDFAGFIAATFKRGIRLTFVPTSLLAQVDASIGGKTAINFGNVKNLVGSFYVPNNVVICSSFLKTLDQQGIFKWIS